MMRSASVLIHRLVACIMTALLLTSATFPQTKVKPGFNLFSVEQDVEMGQEATKEIEKQLPLLDDRETNRYISDLGLSLAKKSTMPDLPWQFKVVNAADVNAFALPGGFIYVNRGLIEAAETEGELVGVLGHEISHVTLRHGTNQLSKATLAQGGLAILGGSLGGGWQGAVAKMGIEFVVGTTFLKFSRGAETQADIVGTQLMQKAGYDPTQMAKMFELLGQLRDSEPSRLEEFFSSHPNPDNRVKRVNEEIAKLPRVVNPIVTTREFNSIKARLKKMPPPPKAQPKPETTSATGPPAAPSSKLTDYRHPRGWYEISYPSNWKPYEQEGSVLFAPDGGVRQVNNQSKIEYGALMEFFAPDQSRSRGTLSLEAATEQLIAQLRGPNPHLQVVRGSQQRNRINGVETVTVLLEGAPSAQEPVERVFMATRWMGREIVSLIGVAPRDEFKTYQGVFNNMVRRWRVNN